VDFKSAFDSVDREMMWQILVRYVIPTKIINIIKQLYCDASLRILHRDRIGTGFGVESGVKQGCILSPFLFNIILDTMRKVSLRRRVTKTKIRRINPKRNAGFLKVMHIGSEVVEEVDKFIYLEIVISKNGGTEDDVCNHIRLVNAAFGSL
jgi:hypothetical protein